MIKPKSAAPVALKLREFCNQNGYTLEIINRAMVILSNQSLHHLLGKDNTKGSQRSFVVESPVKPPVQTSVVIDDEHCAS
jgi:hypothetical protein